MFEKLENFDFSYLNGVNSEGDKIGFLGLFLADFLLGLSGLYIVAHYLDKFFQITKTSIIISQHIFDNIV